MKIAQVIPQVPVIESWGRLTAFKAHKHILQDKKMRDKEINYVRGKYDTNKISTLLN